MSQIRYYIDPQTPPPSLAPTPPSSRVLKKVISYLIHKDKRWVRGIKGLIGTCRMFREEEIYGVLRILTAKYGESKGGACAHQK